MLSPLRHVAGAEMPSGLSVTNQYMLLRVLSLVAAPAPKGHLIPDNPHWVYLAQWFSQTVYVPGGPGLEPQCLHGHFGFQGFK